MIKELRNYFKLKEREANIYRLKTTIVALKNSKLSFSMRGVNLDELVDTSLIEDEYSAFLLAAENKINKVIEELENKPL